MAQRGFFFQDDGGDRVYDAKEWSHVWRQLSRNGVTPGNGGQCQVVEASTLGMRVDVQTGSAWVEGRMIDIYQRHTLNIDSNSSGNPRIDRIIARLDESSRTLTLEVLKGTAASSPSPPALTRSGGTYELSLAQVYVADGATQITTSNITDERFDPTVCGLSIHPALSLSSGEWVEVASYVDDGTASAFDYTYTLPSEDAACFDEYRIVGYIDDVSGNAENDIGLQFNNDTGSNYYTVIFDDQGVRTISSTSPGNYILITELNPDWVGTFETWLTGRHKYGAANPRVSSIASSATVAEEKGLDGYYNQAVNKISAFRIVTEAAARGAIRIFGRNLWNTVYPN